MKLNLLTTSSKTRQYKTRQYKTRQYKKFCRQSGFTLLEVLVAMLIFGTTVAFLLDNLSLQQRHHAEIEIKTIAHWVAMNKMAETRIAPQWPSIGVTRGEVSMRNRSWYWLQTVSKTTEAKLRQVEIEVRVEESDELPATTFIGYIAEKKSDFQTLP